MGRGEWKVRGKLFRKRMYRLVHDYDHGGHDGKRFMNGIVRAMKKAYAEGFRDWRKVMTPRKRTP